MFYEKIKNYKIDEHTSDLEFTRIIMNIIKDKITFNIVDNELKIYEKNGLISEVRDVDWFTYWIQVVFPEQIMNEIKEFVELNSVLNYKQNLYLLGRISKLIKDRPKRLEIHPALQWHPLEGLQHIEGLFRNLVSVGHIFYRLKRLEQTDNLIRSMNIVTKYES